jgi:D-aminopeptidase
MDAIVRDTLAQPGNENVRSVNALVGETNDGTLNDIRGLHVTTAHVMSAIEAARRSASGSKVEEGAVGAGTGTICYGWKGGIGTASRVLPANAGGYVLGVIVQTNFGGNLTIDGIPIWKSIGKAASAASKATNADGSCMIVIATNAPLTSRDLQRVAARGVFGLARTGSSYSHGSGDFAIAFSTSAEVRVRAGDTTPRAHTLLPSEAISPLFEAALEATEEAVYNSLFRATTTTANSRTIEALPIDRVKALINPTASRPR